MGTQKGGYFLQNGDRVPSVTTIISNCKLGGIEPLLAWANREGRAGKDHRETRDIAADAGTCAHEMVEADIRRKPFDGSRFTEEALMLAEGAFEAYQEWKAQTQLRVVNTELPLVSERYRYGGTMDAMLVNGKLSLGDWKTSSGVYADFLCQLAAYGTLWTENNPNQPITGGFHLIKFSKQHDPTDPVHFSHHYWSDLSLAWTAFKHMRELYDLGKRLKKMAA